MSPSRTPAYRVASVAVGWAAVLLALAAVPVAARADFYTLTDVGALGGSTSSAWGINASGQVVGSAGTAFNRAEHAFLYSGGRMTDLGTLGGSYSIARGINASGQVVGYSYTANYAYHPFLYSGGTMTDLGTLGGSDSNAFGINDSGQVVGRSYLVDNRAEHAFLYSGGMMTDLNGLLPAGSGWTLIFATGINDAGQIVGVGEDPNLSRRAFLLTPVPEPSSLALAVVGLVGALALAGRRRSALSRAAG